MMFDVDPASECTLRGALPLILGASRVLGVAPVRLTRAPGGQWSAQVAPRLLSYSYLHLCVFSVYSLLSLILKFAFKINLSFRAYSFGDILWTLHVVQLGGTVMVGVYGVHERMDAIISGLSTIEPIHVHYKSAKFLRRLYIKESILIIAWLSHVSLDIFRWFYFYINDDEGEIDAWKLLLPGYLYLFCLSSLLMTLFALPALRVTAALRAMNHSLRDLLYLVDLQILGFHNSDMVLDKSLIVDTMRIENRFVKKVHQLKGDVCGSIRHFSTCFEAVQRAAIGLNDTFGFILIFNYGFLLIFITVAPYRLILLLLQEDVGYFYTLGEALDICMYFLCILLGVEPGHEIEREVSCMRCTVSELLSRAASLVVRDEQEERSERGKRGHRGERNEPRERGDDAEVLAFLLNVLSKQLTVPDLCFAPKKSFKLKRTLVPMLLTTSVTLTLVLIQIKELRE